MASPLAPPHQIFPLIHLALVSSRNAPFHVEMFRPKSYRCSALSDIFQSNRTFNLEGLEHRGTSRSEQLAATAVGQQSRERRTGCFEPTQVAPCPCCLVYITSVGMHVIKLCWGITRFKIRNTPTNLFGPFVELP